MWAARATWRNRALDTTLSTRSAMSWMARRFFPLLQLWRCPPEPVFAGFIFPKQHGLQLDQCNGNLRRGANRVSCPRPVALANVDRHAPPHCRESGFVREVIAKVKGE